jgi:hypothetical protein
MAKRRRHSIGEISCHAVDKKPRRQTNNQNQPLSSQSSQLQSSQASQKAIDDILDLVATGGRGDGTAEGAAASIAGAVATAATLQAVQNENAPPGVASPVMYYAALEKLVSQCVAAQVAPMSAAITALQKELQQMKQAVVKLSKQIGEMTTVKCYARAHIPAAGSAGPGANKMSSAGSAALLSQATCSKAAAAAQPTSQSSQPADHNISHSDRRQPVSNVEISEQSRARACADMIIGDAHEYVFWPFFTYSCHVLYVFLVPFI